MITIVRFMLYVALLQAGCGDYRQDSLAYDVRLAQWSLGSCTDAHGDQVFEHGYLYDVKDGACVAGQRVSSLEELMTASAPYSDDRSTRLPTNLDWVLVLGQHEQAGHRQLRRVRTAQRLAFQGRVYEARENRLGELELRENGDVISQVEHTFEREASRLLSATVEGPDGVQHTLHATAEHPFFVPEEDTYRPLSGLDAGTKLQLEGGDCATLIGVEEVEADESVFNLEVAGQHNYYAGPLGVMVHNAGKNYKNPKRKRRSRNNFERCMDFCAQSARGYPDALLEYCKSLRTAVRRRQCRAAATLSHSGCRLTCGFLYSRTVSPLPIP